MADNILETLRDIAYNGPTRVVVDSSGEVKPPIRAKRENGIESDVIFVSNDGWSLGAPIELCDVAEDIHDAVDWVVVIHKPFPKIDNQERLVIGGVDRCH
jgi:hypothetical protein